MLENMTIRVVPYNPEWPRLFEAEAKRVTAALGDIVLRAHHIGSTSIPGIKAKPIIDILLEVMSIDEIDAATSRLEQLGYEAMGEFGIPGRRYFRMDNAAGERIRQVHAFQADTPNVARHLAFRDYMRANPGVAAQYGALKERLARAYAGDAGSYVNGKDPFIKEHERRALRWAASRRQGANFGSRV